MRSSGSARPPGNLGMWRRSRSLPPAAKVGALTLLGRTRGLPPAAKVGALTLLGPRVGNPKGPGGFAVALAAPGVFDGSCSAPAAPSCSVHPSSSSTHLGMLGVRCLVAAGYRQPTSTLGIEKDAAGGGVLSPWPFAAHLRLVQSAVCLSRLGSCWGYFLFCVFAWHRARQKAQQCNRAGGRWDMRPI